MRISWIEPNQLAASGIPLGKDDIESLHQQGIRAIITLTEPPLTNQSEITDALVANLDILLFHIPLVDQHPPENPQMVVDLKSIIDRMKAESKPVLIHCHAGIGRTGTMLHAYYIASGYSLDEAKLKVKLARQMSQFFMLADAQQDFLEQLASGNKTGSIQNNQQQAIQASSIDHTCLLVSNLEKARGYYQALFSLKIRPHPNADRTLMCEDGNIHFFLEEVDFPSEFLSKQHLSFRVTDRQKIMDTLQSLGIPFQTGKFEGFEYHNYYWVEWRDPDGIRLECIELID